MAPPSQSTTRLFSSRAFVNRNPAGYLSPALFYSVSLARFCLLLPEMFFQRRVFRRFLIEMLVNGRW
jgi:hypothetical protein